ncbi:hypothetical protein RHS01_03899 [Rhizoctonia solani]|uniref:Uncharacterized protein n=1 Tax=Rhizoctonia solani TaxID=456999 RepID=A0A8H7M6R1_9AGAM|nr:hypothetical protein RHS01_03899 [Rhizoctonia solani]
MRTVISSSHPDPNHQPRDSPPQTQAPRLDDSALDPALNDEHLGYPPDSQPPVVPSGLQQMASTSASPPPQYIATGQPPDGTEWGDVPRLPPSSRSRSSTLPQPLPRPRVHLVAATTPNSNAQFPDAVAHSLGASTSEATCAPTPRSVRLYVNGPDAQRDLLASTTASATMPSTMPNPTSISAKDAGKTFSRTDALNRHLRSDGGSGCRKSVAAKAGPSTSNPPPPPPPVPVSDPAEGHPPPPPPPGAPADPNLHHIHPHQLPPELNPQFLAGLLSGQQFLAAAAAANDPNHPHRRLSLMSTTASYKLSQLHPNPNPNQNVQSQPKKSPPNHPVNAVPCPQALKSSRSSPRFGS